MQCVVDVRLVHSQLQLRRVLQVTRPVQVDGPGGGGPLRPVHVYLVVHRLWMVFIMVIFVLLLNVSWFAR